MGIKCDANVISEEEQDIDFAIIPNANDTFTVKYMPPAAGRYTVKVLFAGEVCILLWFWVGARCYYSGPTVSVNLNYCRCRWIRGPEY